MTENRQYFCLYTSIDNIIVNTTDINNIIDRVRSAVDKNIVNIMNCFPEWQETVNTFVYILQ